VRVVGGDHATLYPLRLRVGDCLASLQDTLEFLLARYSMFGEFLGVEPLKNQFFYCDASKGGSALLERGCARLLACSRTLQWCTGWTCVCACLPVCVFP
jgi:hypothetical protein